MHDDYDLIIKGGPWFVGGRFLKIRKRIPNFRAFEASFSLVVVWIRLPELPIEYYDIEILTKIGKKLGTLLRLDNFTISEERGKLARCAS
ncbi:hypothetical protein REPUB_Repub19eG0115400 [Reevesia pubescens]